MAYHAKKPWENDDDHYIGDSNNPAEKYADSSTEYGSNPSAEYNKHEEDSKKDEKESKIEQSVTKETKKYEKKEDAPEEQIKKTAAQQVFEGNKDQNNIRGPKKGKNKSIEDAINKAMKEEKEVIYMDD